MKSGPRSPQVEKAHAQQRRPNAAKNKINKFIKIKKREGVNQLLINPTIFTEFICVHECLFMHRNINKAELGKSRKEDNGEFWILIQNINYRFQIIE